jgi:hypothetical protein
MCNVRSVGRGWCEVLWCYERSFKREEKIAQVVAHVIQGSGIRLKKTSYLQKAYLPPTHTWFT